MSRPISPVTPPRATPTLALGHVSHQRRTSASGASCAWYGPPLEQGGLARVAALPAVALADADVVGRAVGQRRPAAAEVAQRRVEALAAGGQPLLDGAVCGISVEGPVGRC